MWGLGLSLIVGCVFVFLYPCFICGIRGYVDVSLYEKVPYASKLEFYRFEFVVLPGSRLFFVFS